MDINSLSAVGGLINPGDFVDIIARLDLPDEEDVAKKSGETLTTVLFQNIQVLAVGVNYDPLGEVSLYEAQQTARSLNITFAVNPDEASLLTFARDNGTLQLSLRSSSETQDRILQQVASWDALAEFVLERQGTELLVPKKAVDVKEIVDPEEEEEELKPFIEIYRGGEEI